MNLGERGRFKSEFQSKPVYKEPERSPFVVVGQTYNILKLYAANLPNRSPAEEYLKNYTLAYIRTAEFNTDSIFNSNNIPIKVDLESREAASHAYTVFGSIPELTTIPSIPALKNGFSKRGILRAPGTKEEYLSRTREIKVELARIVNGVTPPGDIMRTARFSLLRTLVFFRVGALLQPDFHFSPGEKEILDRQEEEREKINKMMQDIDMQPIDD